MLQLGCPWGKPCSCFDGITSKGSAHLHLAALLLPSKHIFGSHEAATKQRHSQIDGQEQKHALSKAALEIPSLGKGMQVADATSPSSERSTNDPGSEAREEPASVRSEASGRHEEPRSSQAARDGLKEQAEEAQCEARPEEQRWWWSPSRHRAGSDQAPAYPATPRAVAGSVQAARAGLAGTWRYHRASTYRLGEAAGERWRFDEVHDTGRSVSGILQPDGDWLCGELAYTDTSEVCGTIRLRLLEDRGVVLSNFSPYGKPWWSDDMVARKEPEAETERRPWDPPEAGHEEDCERPSHMSTASAAHEAGDLQDQPGASGARDAGKKGTDRIPRRVREKLARTMHKTRRLPAEKAGSRQSEHTEANRDSSQAGSLAWGPTSSAFEDDGPGSIGRPTTLQMPVTSTRDACCPQLFATCCHTSLHQDALEQYSPPVLQGPGLALDRR